VDEAGREGVAAADPVNDVNLVAAAEAGVSAVEIDARPAVYARRSSSHGA